MDQGKQNFTYWLLAHAGSRREAGTVRLAHERTAPLLTLPVRAHHGALPACWSFLDCEQRGAEVAVLKLAEHGAGLGLRLHEASGAAIAALAFPLWGIGAEVPLGHHEVKTIRLSWRGESLRIEETNLLEDPRADGFRTEVKIGDSWASGGYGHSLPEGTQWRPS